MSIFRLRSLSGQSESSKVNNLYGYVAGNSISFSDPSGLAPGDKGYGYNDKNFQDWAHGEKQAMGRASDENLCKSDDDNDPCDIILDKGQLKAAGIRGCEHEVKADELGTNRNLSKFDLCGCKDGRVVVKAHGCKGPVISVTDYRWK